MSQSPDWYGTMKTKSPYVEEETLHFVLESDIKRSRSYFGASSFTWADVDFEANAKDENRQSMHGFRYKGRSALGYKPTWRSLRRYQFKMLT